MTRCLLALLLAWLPLSASAQTIYKCIDANGSTTYASSRLDKNCKVISSGPENSLPAPKARPVGAAANPSPSGFPRVAEDAQKARDGDRRHILEQELAGEQRSLEQVGQVFRAGDDHVGVLGRYELEGQLLQLGGFGHRGGAAGDQHDGQQHGKELPQCSLLLCMNVDTGIL